MTVNNKNPTDAEQSTTADKKKKTGSINRHELILYIISFFLIICLASATGYFVNQIKAIKNAGQATTASSENQNEKTSRKISALEQETDQLKDQIGALSASLSEMYKNQPGNNEDWALSEVEYLLIIATHRLVLEHDVVTALKAMEAASQRLDAIGDSGLIPVREQITSDMNRLRSVNTVDITGLSIYLADMIEKIDDLPVKKPDLQKPDADSGKQQQDISEKNGSGVEKIFSKIWSELKSLVVIRKSGDVNSVLLLPDQEYFLYQNLRLELENARISVLRRNTESLHSSVMLITDWLQKYFDTSDSGVVNLLGSLRKMTTLELDPDLPDISSSLETLHAYMHQRDTAKLPDNNIMAPVT